MPLLLSLLLQSLLPLLLPLLLTLLMLLRSCGCTRAAHASTRPRLSVAAGRTKQERSAHKSLTFRLGTAGKLRTWTNRSPNCSWCQQGHNNKRAAA